MNTYGLVVNIVHLLFAALILYICIMKFNGKDASLVFYVLLSLLGFGALGYHGYWLIYRLANQK